MPFPVRRYSQKRVDIRKIGSGQLNRTEPQGNAKSLAAKAMVEQKENEMARTEDKAGEKDRTACVLALDPAKTSGHLHAVAEETTERSTGALVKFASDAEDAGRMLKTIFQSARAVRNELSLETVALLRTNAEAAFSHLQALVGAKAPSEAIELQSNFLRQSAEMCVEQAREFQALTIMAAADLSRPINDILEKALTDVEAA
ncbi:phasin family protein [Mesorhizobium sophorae]|uniref:phasin family protein n=1 Tax=Mesorhizobium sophorae TaxID=1300294 RepID=UPI00142D9A00|nr:phasin family protein [Mesorhizobium sophorae]